jgi:DNA-binding XRE family transcriptional regulator
MKDRVYRPLDEERRRENQRIREAAMREFPPADTDGPLASPPGIPSQVKAARVAAGLNWTTLAQQAGVEDHDVRAIEYGHDVSLSTLEAVAKALSLHVELVAGRTART